MKINEMIRELRIKKGFTQEQLASLLGVSAPAVNKCGRRPRLIRTLRCCLRWPVY